MLEQLFDNLNFKSAFESTFVIDLSGNIIVKLKLSFEKVTNNWVMLWVRFRHFTFQNELQNITKLYQSHRVCEIQN